MNSSLYIHIPFCAAKCSYCSFNSYAGLERLRKRYVEAVVVECKNVVIEGQEMSLETVFLGGGTPSLLSGVQLQRLFATLTSCFAIADDAEVSIEANPGTVSSEKLKTLRQCGVNRLSIGVQSFNNIELHAIGRIHTAEEARLAIENAQAAGFHNLNIDLMYGLPGQTAKSWQKNLETALSLSVPHLSLYQLTVEAKTPLQTMLEREEIELPHEDVIAEMDAITISLLGESAFEQYEISNYAKDGHQCLHNINYWQNGDYYGIGAGAVSFSHGKRVKNIANPERYCEMLEAGQAVQVEVECLNREESFRETVIMGLRMNRGVSSKVLFERYGLDFETVYGEIVKKLCVQKLLVQNEANFHLTAKGRSFANLVMAELV